MQTLLKYKSELNKSILMNTVMRTQKKTCYIFLFEGFSDWEVSYASVGIQKSESFQIKTIGFGLEPVRSMGGLTVIPDTDFISAVDLADIDPANTAMLILPGGTAWEERSNEAILPLVAHCLLHGIPVAAICGATLFLADLGILNRTPHTSNDVTYLQALCPSYSGRALYQSEPVVSTGAIITASGSAPVEFAREIFSRLDILNDEAVATWFGYMERQPAGV
jgi:putative intracellular protease/amidase